MHPALLCCGLEQTVATLKTGRLIRCLDYCDVAGREMKLQENSKEIVFPIEKPVTQFVFQLQISELAAFHLLSSTFILKVTNPPSSDAPWHMWPCPFADAVPVGPARGLGLGLCVCSLA